MLPARAEQDDYWILPGGRVEFLEDTRTTLNRELLEETGQKMKVTNLLWILENFFRLNGIEYHELAFIYAVSPIHSAIRDNAWTRRTRDGDVWIELRWFDLDDLERTTFQPQFLKPLMADPPQTPQHVIVRGPQQPRS